MCFSFAGTEAIEDQAYLHYPKEKLVCRLNISSVSLGNVRTEHHPEINTVIYTVQDYGRTVSSWSLNVLYYMYVRIPLGYSKKRLRMSWLEQSLNTWTEPRDLYRQLGPESSFA